MHRSKAIFVDGIVGSGKSTTALFLADSLNQRQIAARFLPEGGDGHPLRMASSLPHPLFVWQGVTVRQFMTRSLEKWDAFVRDAGQSNAVTVFDGQLLHGNMTDLFLMNARPIFLKTYIAGVIERLEGLRPVLIYLYQADVLRAIREVCALRGPEWATYQLNWKLPSPYGARRELQGVEGLGQLYTRYRVVSDAIVAGLSIPTLRIDVTNGDWARYRREMLAFLELS